jgi:hypothetical protein
MTLETIKLGRVPSSATARSAQSRRSLREELVHDLGAGRDHWSQLAAVDHLGGARTRVPCEPGDLPAASPRSPPGVLTCSDGSATGTAPAIPAGTGHQAAADLHRRRDRDRVRPANPKLFGEREEARQMLTDQPANRPAPGTAVVTEKAVRAGHRGVLRQPGPATGADPPRPQGRKQPRYFPNWLRQRVEAIIWTLFPNASDFSPHQARVNARIRNCPP